MWKHGFVRLVRDDSECKDQWNKFLLYIFFQSARDFPTTFIFTYILRVTFVPKDQCSFEILTIRFDCIMWLYHVLIRFDCIRCFELWNPTCIYISISMWLLAPHPHLSNQKFDLSKSILFDCYSIQYIYMLLEMIKEYIVNMHWL